METCKRRAMTSWLSGESAQTVVVVVVVGAHTHTHTHTHTLLPTSSYQFLISGFRTARGIQLRLPPDRGPQVFNIYCSDVKASYCGLEASAPETHTLPPSAMISLLFSSPPTSPHPIKYLFSWTEDVKRGS